MKPVRINKPVRIKEGHSRGLVGFISEEGKDICKITSGHENIILHKDSIDLLRSVDYESCEVGQRIVVVRAFSYFEYIGEEGTIVAKESRVYGEGTVQIVFDKDRAKIYFNPENLAYVNSYMWRKL